MFIGWIRKESFKIDIEKLTSSMVVDKNLVFKTITEDQSLCFGAYLENDLVALITAFTFENSILINNLYYDIKDSEDVIRRLLNILLKNINDDKKTILFMANKNEQDIFKDKGFKKLAYFYKAVNSTNTVAFNFTNATSKSISNENYLPTIKKLDFDTFKEDRLHYITNVVGKQSSLLLSTLFGYQHSYAISKNTIKISPWIMVDEAFMDAEKLIRGVIYHRGLKNIISFIPSDVKEITDLYKFYGFEMKDTYTLLYLNEPPKINLESIYGF
jgi:hypothetical protein